MTNTPFWDMTELLWLLGKMILVAVSYFAFAHLGRRIERHRWSVKIRSWKQGADDDDLDGDEDEHCWRKDLVQVPRGSVKIEEFLVGGENQFVEDVPADIFTPEAIGMRLGLPTVNPGSKVQLTLRNTSNFQLTVQAMAMCRVPEQPGYMVPMPFPPVDLLPGGGSGTTCAYPLRVVRIERLVISVPKHLPKPKS